MTRTASRIVTRGLAAACVLLGAGCLHRTVENPNVIVVSLTTGPNNLDPRLGTDDTSQKLAQLIFSS